MRLPEWYDEAACRGMAVSKFFSCMSPRDRDAAKDVCAACPVAAQCLEAAMAEEATRQSAGQNLKGRHGIRGGLSATERWAIAYPAAAEKALRRERNRKRGRPSRIAGELAA